MAFRIVYGLLLVLWGLRGRGKVGLRMVAELDLGMVRGKTRPGMPLYNINPQTLTRSHLGKRARRADERTGATHHPAATLAWGSA